jgi:hypothetical protein
MMYCCVGLLVSLCSVVYEALQTDACHLFLFPNSPNATCLNCSIQVIIIASCVASLTLPPVYHFKLLLRALCALRLGLIGG